jgi:hypothetical protein
MESKHRVDIFNAVRDCLFEQDKEQYTHLYRKVREKIGKISLRDFSSELRLLVEEKKLQRTEDKNSNRKIKPVFFSLTQNAVVEHRLDILGIDVEKERLRRLYQLLFFFSAITSVKDLPQSQVENIKKDLVIETQIHIDNSNVTETIYKPKESLIDHFRIIRREFANVESNKAKVLYYCRLWSFSKEDIVKMVTDIEKQRKIGQWSVMPFVNALLPFTDDEITSAFDTLRDNHLIKPIRDMILEETRFVIADKSLQDLVNEVWAVHWNELKLFQKKIFYFDPPSEEEMRWLKQIYGEHGAMQIIAKSHQIRRVTTWRVQKQIGKYMEYDSKQIDLQIAHLQKKYGNKIQEYNFPPDMIEQVCLRKIFTNMESTSTHEDKRI